MYAEIHHSGFCLSDSWQVHFSKQYPRLWDSSVVNFQFFSATRWHTSVTQPAQLSLHLYVKLSASCWEFNHSNSSQRYTERLTAGYFLYLWTRNNWIFHVFLHIFLRNNQKGKKNVIIGWITFCIHFRKERHFINMSDINGGNDFYII